MFSCYPEYKKLVELHKDIHIHSNKTLTCIENNSCLDDAKQLKDEISYIENISKEMNKIMDKLFAKVEKESCN
jgi:hypothetical protein